MLPFQSPDFRPSDELMACVRKCAEIAHTDASRMNEREREGHNYSLRLWRGGCGLVLVNDLMPLSFSPSKMPELQWEKIVDAIYAYIDELIQKN